MIHESEPVPMGVYPAVDLLKAFFKTKEPLTQAAAAEQLGIVPSALTAYLKGTQRPRSDIRQRIEKWSGGAVPESSWLTAKERKGLAGVEIAVMPDPNEGANSDHPAQLDKPTGTES